MKRFLTCFVAFVLFAAFSPARPPRAIFAAATDVYALVVAENAMLLREPKEASLENSYFTLPATYFVMLVQRDYAPGYHRVRYRDIVGYVNADAVEIKSYTPKSIYPPEVTLKINIDSSNVNVRSLPDINAGRVLHNLSGDAKGVVYYNYVPGVALNGNNNSWYFIRIDLSSDSVIKGYVHASYVLLESTIPPDNDTTAVVVPPEEVPDPGSTTAKKPNTVEIIGILALCIPAVLIVIVIFTRPRKSKESKHDDPKRKYMS